VRWLVVLLAMLPWTALAQDAPSAFGGEEAQPRTPVQPAAPPAPTVTTEEAINQAWENAPLRAKICQLMLVTLEGEHAPSTADFGYLTRYTPAGALVDRVANAKVATAYVTKLRGLEQTTGLPFWVGANLYRLTRPRREALTDFVALPTLMSVGATHDVAAAKQLGQLLAAYCHGMGLNFHLGPSLSLAPDFPGARSAIHTFGSDPVFAGRAGVAMFSAMRDAGIMAVPAGFPGGSFNQKANEPAVLRTPRDALETKDLAPFIAVVKSQPPMMLVDTTIAPTIDSGGKPACLSRDVMQGLLREGLGYQGLIVSGPLDSPELSGVFDPVEAALLALRGGADILYWQAGLGTVMRVVDQLAIAADKGLLDKALIERAFDRVVAVKKRQREEARAKLTKKGGASATVSTPNAEAGVTVQAPVEVQPQEPQQEAAAASTKAEFVLSKTKDVREAVLDIERKSITVLRNRGNVLPLDKSDGPIGVTGVVFLKDFKTKLEGYVKKIGEQPIGTAEELGEIKDFEIERIVKRVRGLRTIVLVLTGELRGPGPQRLVKALQGKGAAVVVVLLGDPRLAMQLGEADAIVLGYCNPANCALTLEAVAEAIMGDGVPGIRRNGETFTVKAGQPRSFNVLEAARIPAGQLPIHMGGEFRLGYSVSYDPGNSLKNVVWNFSDGFSSKAPVFEHAFAAPGTYQVELNVTTGKRTHAAGAYTFVAK
jgi:beta-glucosidase-like glycosyl hydrolase